MKFAHLADAVAYLEAGVAQQVGTYARQLRADGPALGLSAATIEEAIACALDAAEAGLPAARAHLVALFYDFNADG